MNLSLSDLLVRLLIGVLALFIGDRILSLVKNLTVKEILEILVIVVVVLYVAFGSVLQLH